MPAVETIDLSQFPAYLNGLARGMTAGDFRPAWKAVGVVLAADTKKNFAGQHAPDGTPWKPILGYRPRGGKRILRDRGLLMASVTGRGPFHFERETRLSFEWGTNLEYAATHQYGAVIRPKNARALAIPLTVEAARYDSPLNFPRHLRLVWPKGRSSGWLVEDKPGTKRAGLKAKTILHYKLAAKATVPARPFLGFNPPLVEKIGMVLADHAAKRFAEGKQGG